MAEWHPTHKPVRSDDDAPEETHTECDDCGIDGMDPGSAEPCPYMDGLQRGIVMDLRSLSERLEALRQIHVRAGRDDTVYFPPAEAGEEQPVPLVEYVSEGAVAGLLHYVADMLEE